MIREARSIRAKRKPILDGLDSMTCAVFDRQVLLTGSYNWSTAAEESNDENAVFIRTPSLVAAYQSTFDNLWLTR